ncbi:uncharacterized protein MKK02DRAFT_35786 [Dioszegia hungarica]|uniref:F-box domain-containing protein n=1 Tax=Dioszegia hungarica TaxID=4972 RepID=A0AA38HEE8_9TREE|nr:uncharacterized protein MKK02DRAFT_35786 [Dioszegia hungarica]KAI9638856.1 hypothetical protein MKK02DRAFT_35786 [Dioszegia hungarica]
MASDTNVEASTTSLAPILRLPPEIFSYFLDHVPASQLQRTALALHQVFPDARVTEEYLWRYVTVRKGEQLVPLWHAARRRRERVEREGMRARVGGFVMESWRGDADILNNTLRCLPDIPVLCLNMGTNFAPEHLAEMFQTHRPTMQRLELRFKPYVEQASYYQFLKGSYFDTAIEMLTQRWPESPTFTRLAIIQEIPPRTKRPAPTFSAGTTASTADASTAVSTVASTAASTVPSSQGSPVILPDSLNADVAALDLGSDEEVPAEPVAPVVEPRGYTGHGPFEYLGDKLAWARPKTFAQPIVFFDIKCIARFGAAPAARHLTHLRLRVPSRDVVSLLLAPPGSTYFPSLTYLDISTTNVRLDGILSAMLRQYEQVEHLVMDRVNLFGFQAKDKGAELCRNLGGLIPSAGLARGKDRERAIAMWDVADRTRAAIAQAEAVARANHGGGGGGGGLRREETPIEEASRQAREAAEERERQLNLARARRGHRSAGMATFSLRNSNLRRSSVSAAGSSAAAAGVILGPPDRLYLILPPLPALRTISVGGEARLSAIQAREWNAEFHAGWREGLAKVAGWAAHIGERYERARRKADEWAVQELRATESANAAGKGKGKAVLKVPTARPPTDIRLYRYPLPGESATPLAGPTPSDPTAGLVQIDPEGSTYLAIYKDRQADAELYANDNSNPPPCVLCTVPDCEGPPRRGDEGGKVDGRGGMDGIHAEGCGHMVGRRTWGWEGM